MSSNGGERGPSEKERGGGRNVVGSDSNGEGVAAMASDTLTPFRGERVLSGLRMSGERNRGTASTSPSTRRLKITLALNSLGGSANGTAFGSGSCSGAVGSREGPALLNMPRYALARRLTPKAFSISGPTFASSHYSGLASPGRYWQSQDSCATGLHTHAISFRRVHAPPPDGRGLLTAGEGPRSWGPVAVPPLPTTAVSEAKGKRLNSFLATLALRAKQTERDSSNVNGGSREQPRLSQASSWLGTQQEPSLSQSPQALRREVLFARGAAGTVLPTAASTPSNPMSRSPKQQRRRKQRAPSRVSSVVAAPDSPPPPTASPTFNRRRVRCWWPTTHTPAENGNLR
jgi:hypothetical protein